MAHKKIQLGATLLLFGLALLLCLSLVFIVTHARHDCLGTHCPLCLQISHFTIMLRDLTSMGIFMLSMILFGYATALVLSGETVMWLTGRSLVALRTRMDD